jgi:hypothetical protein
MSVYDRSVEYSNRHETRLSKQDKILVGVLSDGLFASSPAGAGFRRSDRSESGRHVLNRIALEESS